MDYLVSNEKRNKYIRNLAASLNGNTLCLFQYVEKHGKQLYETIRERRMKPTKKSSTSMEELSPDEREKIREITEKSDNNDYCGSLYGTFEPGH